MLTLQVITQIILKTYVLNGLKVERDDEVIKSLEEAVKQFDIEIEDLIIKIQDGGNKNG